MKWVWCLMTINDYNPIFCTFIRIADKEYRCTRCNNTVLVADSIEEPPIFPCSSLLVNFDANKLHNNMAANNQEDLCETLEITVRHNICLGCEFFQDNTCQQCGCFLSRDRTFMNKLAKKKESCPIGLW